MAWLARLGLRTKEQRAWAMYDWANSAFQCTIITAVFPVYFVTVAAADLPGSLATQRYATATTIALAVVALIAPLLGAYADVAAAKKRLLALFLAIGAAATAGLWFVERGDWQLGAALFILANIGVSASFVFYDSLLPHIAEPEEMDRVSSAGYAMGYLGGGLLLLVNLAWIMAPETFGLADPGVASRLAFVSVALWWAGFSIPLFRHVPEPRVLERPRGEAPGPLRAALLQLARTLRELGRFRQAALMLLAFLIYNDGIGTIIRMAGSYGAEIGLPASDLIAAIVIVQFVGIPCAVLFGALAGRIGARAAIFLALLVYCVISVLGYFMTEVWQFYLLATLVGTVQGGSQALSRSLFASMIPRHRSSEFFGFFGVFEKFAGIVGPAMFAMTIHLTGSSRNAILSVIAFFVVGAVLLALVNVSEGQRSARAAELAMATETRS